MGARFRTTTLADCSNEKELMAAWAALQKQDAYDIGHDAYHGSWLHTHLTISRQTFSSPAEALRVVPEKLADSEKGVAYAFRFGSTQAFPSTAADKSIQEKALALRKELEWFERNILLRFLASKSASKRCPSCDSVISKKSRQAIVRGSFERDLQATEGKHLERRELISSQTSCPACFSELLVTETDKKRRASLATRSSDADKALQKARDAHRAKHGEFGYLVAGWVPD